MIFVTLLIGNHFYFHGESIAPASIESNPSGYFVRSRYTAILSFAQYRLALLRSAAIRPAPLSSASISHGDLVRVSSICNSGLVNSIELPSFFVKMNAPL